jgi:hypothetical protein
MLESDRQFAPKPRKDLAVESIDDDLIVLDRKHGQIHQLNETARIVWEALAAGHSLHTIAGSMVKRFGVPQDTAAADIEKVVSQFETLKLLESER